jgi:hypothetical protein
MKPIKVLAISMPAFSLLDSRTPFHVHSKFDQVCNLLTPQKTILSLLTPAIGLQPTSILLTDSQLWQTWQNGQPVSLDNLDLSDCEMWDPRPDWEAVHGLDLVNRIPAFPIPFKPSDHTQKQALAALATGIQLRHPTIIQQGAEPLAGLGIGLTPTGDDFLLGVMYGLWATMPAAVAQPLCQAIVEVAVPRTTTLSGLWLREGGVGNAGIHWHTLLYKIQNPKSKIQNLLAPILSLGNTSGTDTLAGFTFALKITFIRN